MKRAAMRFLLYLAAGVIVNTAVAAFCAQCFGLVLIRSREDLKGIAQLLAEAVTKDDGGLNPEQAIGVQHRSGAQYGWHVHDVGSLDKSGDETFNARWAVGWPYIAVGTRVEVLRGVEVQRGFAIRLLDRPARFPRETVSRCELPLHPIWPGFAINTVFYAAMLWLLFAVPFALRRLRGGRRIKRGLCPKCAYPVGTWGGDKCTECGAAVTPPPKAATA